MVVVPKRLHSVRVSPRRCGSRSVGTTQGMQNTIMTLQAHQEIQPAVYGHSDTRFQHLAAALSKEICSGGELGAAISVDVDGGSVVDIWGGHTDRGQTKKWSERTIVNVWPCPKTISTRAPLFLAAHG